LAAAAAGLKLLGQLVAARVAVELVLGGVDGLASSMISRASCS
jgi:hypothetical protein